jgi:hypothetical protein
MPPFLIPVLQALAATAAYDALRARARRFVPRPAPPPFSATGGPIRPPLAGAGRTYPLTRPAVDVDRRR